jgi:hypothetical protein
LFLIQRNALIIGSVFHHILVQYYEQKTDLIEFDWVDVPESERVFSIPYLQHDD